MPVPVFTAGETLDASEMNAVGLWRVTNCTVTSAGGTAATASNGVITLGNGNTSVTINNAFSADYSAYLIKIENLRISAGSGFPLTIGNASAGYYWSGVVVSYSTSAITAEVGNNVAAWASGTVADNSGVASTEIRVTQPFASARTTYTAHGVDSRTGGAGCRTYSGFLDNTNSYTSVGFTTTAGSVVSGTIRVYGYRN